MSCRAQWALILLLLAATPGRGQVVYESTSHTGIYELLDELANEKLIELNDAVKPYTRLYIATKLLEAKTSSLSASRRRGERAGGESLDSSLSASRRRGERAGGESSAVGSEAKRSPDLSGSAASLSGRLLEEIDFYLRDYHLELQQMNSPLFIRLRRIERAGGESLENNKKQLTSAPRLKASYNPLAFSYRDSSFAFSLRPVAAAGLAANRNDTYLSASGGLHAFGYWSRHFGVSVAWFGYYENVSLSVPTYFNSLSSPSPGWGRAGVGARLPTSLVEWSASYSWKWGSISILRDSPEWGVNYAGANILSGNAPPFTQVRLQLRPVRWFEFTYFHGWLDSDVVDSARSWRDGDEYHEVFRKKFIAANMFTLFPVRHLGISFGNSMLYSDNDVHLAYLVPFLFYKSVDHTLTSMNESAAQNAQMFFGISSRNIRHLHLHLTLFVDELSVKRIGNPDKHNFLSWKGGFRLSNWPLKDIAVTSEYTRTLPMTFQHRVSTTTFENSSYQLGHYLGSNSEEIFLSLSAKPVRGLRLMLSYIFARHGDDVHYGFYEPSDGAPVLENITWQRSSLSLRSSYEIVPRAGVSLGLSYSNTRGFDVGVAGEDAQYYLDRFGPAMFHGKAVTVEAGVWIR